jgi:acyl-CoA thioesterase FadM
MAERTEFWWPDEPEVAPEARGSGEAPVSYEDIAQDGRLNLLPLAHAFGSVVWRQLLIHHPVVALNRSGVVPILTRFVFESGEGPFSVRWPLAVDGRFQLAHTLTNGDVDHLMLNMWVNATAPLGRTHGPAPKNAGQAAYAGRGFAEHVFTRLFAPASERKVRRLIAPGLEPVPSASWTWRPPQAVLELPPGATPLDAGLTDDEAPIVFGLTHTDSNQHVNSLVYPRLFQDAVLRRLSARGKSTKVLGRRLEIAYRKPCFAGERARFKLQAYELGDKLGAVGVLVPDGVADAKPYCTVHLVMTA